MSRASYARVQATVGVGTVLIWDFGIAYTRGGGGTVELSKSGLRSGSCCSIENLTSWPPPDGEVGSAPPARAQRSCPRTTMPKLAPAHHFLVTTPIPSTHTNPTGGKPTPSTPHPTTQAPPQGLGRATTAPHCLRGGGVLRVKFTRQIWPLRKVAKFWQLGFLEVPIHKAVARTSAFRWRS